MIKIKFGLLLQLHQHHDKWHEGLDEQDDRDRHEGMLTSWRFLVWKATNLKGGGTGREEIRSGPYELSGFDLLLYCNNSDRLSAVFSFSSELRQNKWTSGKVASELASNSGRWGAWGPCCSPLHLQLWRGEGREGRELEGKEEKLEVGKGRRMDVAMREGEEQMGVRFIIELVFSTCTHHCTYYDRLIPVC